MTTRTLEKITVVVAVVVLGVSLAVSVRAAPAMLLLAALVVTVSAGLDLVLRGEARYRPTPDLFILPATLVVGAVLFLQLLPTGAYIVTGLALFGALLFAIFWAEHSIRLGLPSRRAGETTLTVITYVTAFVLYAAVYQSKARSLFSAPAMIAITLLLAARQLRLAQEAEDEAPAPAAPAPAAPGPGAGPRRSEAAAAPRRAGDSGLLPVVGGGARRAPLPNWPRTLLYAAVVALATGELTWALNYWPLNGLLGGAFLLSVFYFLVGVLSHHIQGRLTRRLVAEYGAVATLGALAITAAGLLRRAT